MKKKLLLAMMFLAVCAVTASASVQNIKISGNLDTTFVHRDNFDLGATNGNHDEAQDNIIAQTRLKVDADLTDQVSATVQLINERAWGDNFQTTTTTATGGAIVFTDSGENQVDINLAYVTLREMLYSPLTVKVGRQQWAYGNSFIFDATGTNNVAPSESGIDQIAADMTNQTALDAIRLIFDYKPLTIELMYSKITDNYLVAADSDNGADIDLFGINNTYDIGDKFNSLVEAYFFYKLDKSNNPLPGRLGIAGNTDASENDTIYLPGLRLSTNPIEGLNLQGEFAWQGGTKFIQTTTTDKPNMMRRNAFAGQFIANYQLPVLKDYSPTVGYVYTYVSGDKNPDDAQSNYATTGGNPASTETWTAWDPFFEAQAGGKIYNTLFDLTNAHIQMVSVSAKPITDVTATATWTGIWLAKQLKNPSDAAVDLCPDTDPDGVHNSTQCQTLTIRQPDGTTEAPLVSPEPNGVGQEVDLSLTYDYTEDVKIGTNVGWFIPGNVFRQDNEETAKQALVNVSVAF